MSHLEQFLAQVRLSDQARDNLNKIIDLLNEALQTSELAEFGPKLLSFGSLQTGLATFSSDLDLVISFEELDLDLLDYDTSILALQVIRPILNEKLGLKISEDFIYPSRRCPIISLRFWHCLPRNDNFPAEASKLKFNQCDIRCVLLLYLFTSIRDFKA